MLERVAALLPLLRLLQQPAQRGVARQVRQQAQLHLLEAGRQRA